MEKKERKNRKVKKKINLCVKKKKREEECQEIYERDESSERKK
jgi:hypothetical protein